MDLVHLGLVALAVFCIWETAKPLLPGNLPDLLVALVLGGVTYAMLTYAPPVLLHVLAIVAVVGILHQKVGATTTGAYALRLPSRRARQALPPITLN